MGFLNLAGALWLGCVSASVRRVIPFAASNLATATRVLQDSPSPVTTTYWTLLAQLLWIIIWRGAHRRAGHCGAALPQRRDSHARARVRL